MRKIILGIVVLLFAANIYAQNSQTSVLTVEGKSQVKLIPEEIWFNVTMSVKDNDYKTCADLATQKLARIKLLFTENGIDEKLIKTQNYSIREIQRHDPELRKMVSDGYQATLPLSIRTKRDYNKNDLIFKLIKDNLESNFNLNFSLSEEQIQKVKKELISLAIKDAKEKADIIEQTSGVKLGKITNILYGEPNPVDAYNPPNLRKAGVFMQSEAHDQIIDLLEPNVIRMETNIIIAWKI